MGSHFFWESVQRARVAHFCDRCCNYIEPRETYRRMAWTPRPGSFHILREHTYPSECPPNMGDEMAREMMEAERIALGVPIAFVAEVRQVQKIALNGDVVTEPETHFVPTLLCEAAPCEKEADDPDEEIPF